MTKIKAGFFIMGATILVLTGFIVFHEIHRPAPPFGFDGGGRMPKFGNFNHMIENMRRDMDLSEEQVNKIKSIHAPYSADLEKRRKDIGCEMKKLSDLMADDNFREKEISDTIKKIDEMKLKERLIMLKLRNETMKILSPRQREKMKHRMDRDFSRMKERFEP